MSVIKPTSVRVVSPLARLSPRENSKESPPWVAGRVKDRDRFAVLAKAIAENPDSRQKKEKAVYELFVASRGNARIQGLGEEGMERWIGTDYC